MNFPIQEKSWVQFVNAEFEKPYFQNLWNFIENEYQNHHIYPDKNLIFNAFERTPFHHVKVVILGQDPYHKPGQAHGLSFSVPNGIGIPPSLRNIFKEMHTDFQFTIPSSGDLTSWATAGVLLLNSVLTVQENSPGSHAGKGWETFTDEVIKIISNEKLHCVFILWGNYAQSKRGLIDSSKHLILEAPHPSPLSAYHGFWGCKHFSKCDDYLSSHGLTPVFNSL